MIGRINETTWWIEGSPIGLPVDVLDAPKGALIIDIDTPTLYIKTTGYGDNSGMKQIQAKLDLSDYPTSDPHISGDLWNNGLVLMVSQG